MRCIFDKKDVPKPVFIFRHYFDDISRNVRNLNNIRKVVFWMKNKIWPKIRIPRKILHKYITFGNFEGFVWKWRNSNVKSYNFTFFKKTSFLKIFSKKCKILTFNFKISSFSHFDFRSVLLRTVNITYMSFGAIQATKTQ